MVVCKEGMHLDSTYGGKESQYNPLHIHSDSFHPRESDIHHCDDMGLVNTGLNLRKR